MTTFDLARGRGHATVAVLAVLLLGACGSTGGEAPAAARLSSAETTAGSSSPPAPTQPEIAPTPAQSQTPVGGQPWDEAAGELCDDALGAGFTQVAQTGDAAGVTTFWSSGRRWALCDVAGDTPVLLTATAGRPGFDEQSLGLRATLVGEGEEAAVRFVAGGPLPWPVEAISYTFPDGHAEQARFVVGEDGKQTWWAVSYTATDGPLADPSTDASELPPATVSILGAAAEAFRLPWEDLQRSE